MEVLGLTGHRRKSSAAAGTRPVLNPNPQKHGEATRSKTKDSLLARQLAGGESEAERSARRAADQEVAARLRDEKLLAATDMIAGDPLIAVQAQSPLEERGENPFNAVATSPLPRNFSAATATNDSDRVMALTEENVERLNMTQGSPSMGTGKQNEPEDYFAHYGSDGKHAKFVVPVTDIPGPPPEVASPGGIMRHIDPRDVLQTNQNPALNMARSNSSQLAQELAVPRPSLKMGLRSTSDWSSSNATVRQEKEAEMAKNMKNLKEPSRQAR